MVAASGLRNWKTARGTGAAGYLLKDAEADEVAVAIRAAHRGEVHLGPALSRLLTAALRAPSDSASQLIHAAAPNTVIQDAATVAEVIDQAARQSPDVSCAICCCHGLRTACNSCGAWQRTTVSPSSP